MVPRPMAPLRNGSGFDGTPEEKNKIIKITLLLPLDENSTTREVIAA